MVGGLDGCEDCTKGSAESQADVGASLKKIYFLLFFGLLHTICAAHRTYTLGLIRSCTHPDPPPCLVLQFQLPRSRFSIGYFVIPSAYRLHVPIPTHSTPLPPNSS